MHQILFNFCSFFKIFQTRSNEILITIRNISGTTSCILSKMFRINLLLISLSQRRAAQSFLTTNIREKIPKMSIEAYEKYTATWITIYPICITITIHTLIQYTARTLSNQITFKHMQFGRPRKIFTSFLDNKYCTFFDLLNEFALD